MNTKLGQLLSTLLIIGLALFWSVSILAAENAAAEDTADAADAAESSVVIAADANEEAADAAVAAITRETKIELDEIELDLPIVARSSVQIAAN